MTKKKTTEKEKNCIFCKITKGQIPVPKFWEDKKHLAFFDNHPLRKGHVLVLPKKHTNYVFDLKDKEYAELMLSAKEIAKKLKIKFKVKRIVMLVEGFAVPHVHIHLIPSNKPLNIKGR